MLSATGLTKREPAKSREIEAETMQEALIMFHELSKTYISAANASGHAGEDAELNKVVDMVVRLGKANKGVLTSRAIYEAIRKVRPFVGQAGVMKRLEESLLPRLEELNYVCNANGRVFVNPALLGG